MKKENETKKKTGKVKKIILIVLSVIVAVILAVGVTFAVLYYKGKRSYTDYPINISAPEDAETVSENGERVIYDKTEYVYNKNIASILVLGVDRKDLTAETTIGTAGQADSIYLVLLDAENKTAKVVVIPRDTVTEISKYSVEGKYIGIEKQQICLAYAYGDGRETSAENMKKAVSGLMYGIPIHSYVTLGRDAVAVLTDEIGGVEVPAYDENENRLGYDITVSGKDAVNYVRGRRNDIVNANSFRIDRQKIFMNAFAGKVGEAVKSDVGVALDLFNSLSDKHMDTDIDASQITYLATNYIRGIGKVNFTDIKGETVKNGDKAEFYADKESLYQTVLDMFYIKK